MFRFESPLGADKLLISELEWTERLSGLFEGHLLLVSEDFDIDFAAILRRPVSAGVQRVDGSFRWFHGFVTRFRQVHHKGRLAYYAAEIRPWLWFLTLSDDCYIHQKRSVPDVVKTVFQKFGFSDFTDRLMNKHHPWVYCCQYRESAFTFVTRLMEMEGIYYYFQHEKDKHTLIMADSRTSQQSCPDNAKFRFEHALGEGVARQDETIASFDYERVLRPARYTHKEYNYKTPQLPLLAERNTQQNPSLDNVFEIYDYPGDYEHNDEGDDWARLRSEEEDSDHETARGTSFCPTMTAGFRFDFSDYHRQDYNKTWMITSVTHRATEGSFIAGSDAQEGNYENRFEAIPDERQYRPKRSTPTPQMLGSQTAFVVGPAGEEIYTDELGRVKVRFHWDRDSAKDPAGCTCWIRVMQSWAGARYGHVWIPRIGQEVIVDFLEGDPDRPIITGAVYHANNKPPLELPGEKTRSGLRTRSTKGGGVANANELWFEDKKGAEKVILHAERDLEVSVENDEFEFVDRDRELTVKRDQTELVKGDKQTHVEGDVREKYDKKYSRQAGGDSAIKTGMNYAVEAGGEIHLKAAKIVLEAKMGVSVIGTSGSFVDVGAAGVVIQGPTTFINCGMPAPMSGQGARPDQPKNPVGTASPAPSGAAGAAVAQSGAALASASGSMMGAGISAAALGGALKGLGAAAGGAAGQSAAAAAKTGGAVGAQSGAAAGQASPPGESAAGAKPGAAAGATVGGAASPGGAALGQAVGQMAAAGHSGASGPQAASGANGGTAASGQTGGAAKPGGAAGQSNAAVPALQAQAQAQGQATGDFLAGSGGSMKQSAAGASAAAAQLTEESRKASEEGDEARATAAQGVAGGLAKAGDSWSAGGASLDAAGRSTSAAAAPLAAAASAESDDERARHLDAAAAQLAATREQLSAASGSLDGASAGLALAATQAGTAAPAAAGSFGEAAAAQAQAGQSLGAASTDADRMSALVNEMRAGNRASGEDYTRLGELAGSLSQNLMGASAGTAKAGSSMTSASAALGPLQARGEGR
jgi:type VI secretion system secreted protein VgrG